MGHVRSLTSYFFAGLIEVNVNFLKPIILPFELIEFHPILTIFLVQAIVKLGLPPKRKEPQHQGP
jgi:uncharacterized protein YggT (Ycf19 family)